MKVAIVLLCAIALLSVAQGITYDLTPDVLTPTNDYKVEGIVKTILAVRNDGEEFKGTLYFKIDNDSVITTGGLCYLADSEYLVYDYPSHQTVTGIPIRCTIPVLNATSKQTIREIVCVKTDIDEVCSTIEYAIYPNIFRIEGGGEVQSWLEMNWKTMTVGIGILIIIIYFISR